MDKLPMPSAAAGRPTALGGTLNTAARSTGFAMSESENQFVVVHVVAKREAIQNKSFDRLLASHGIDLVSQSPNDQRKTISGHAFRKQASELAIKQADESAAEQDTDFVLVEAPKPTIISCLASLNKDSANYVGINVDQSAVPRKTTSLRSLAPPRSWPMICSNSPVASPRSNKRQPIVTVRIIMAPKPPQLLLSVPRAQRHGPRS